MGRDLAEADGVDAALGVAADLGSGQVGIPQRQRVSGIGVVPSVEEGGLAGIQLAMVRS